MNGACSMRGKTNSHKVLELRNSVGLGIDGSIVRNEPSCCCSCHWGETMSLNCGHLWAVVHPPDDTYLMEPW
jgi:hypothetical protein